MLDQEVISILSQEPDDSCRQSNLLTIWLTKNPGKTDVYSSFVGVEPTPPEKKSVRSLAPMAEQNLQRQLQEHKERPKQGLTFRPAPAPAPAPVPVPVPVHRSLRRL